MQGRCDNDPLDTAEDICDFCGGEFCESCLVYPRGPKKPPVCKGCALNGSGVRGGARVQRKTNRRDAKKRRKELEEAKASAKSAEFVFFDEEEGHDYDLPGEDEGHEPEVKRRRVSLGRRRKDDDSEDVNGGEEEEPPESDDDEVLADRIGSVMPGDQAAPAAGDGAATRPAAGAAPTATELLAKLRQDEAMASPAAASDPLSEPQLAPSPMSLPGAAAPAAPPPDRFDPTIDPFAVAGAPAADPSPVAPTPITPAPITPAPVTPAPVTPAPAAEVAPQPFQQPQPQPQAQPQPSPSTPPVTQPAAVDPFAAATPMASPAPAPPPTTQPAPATPQPALLSPTAEVAAPTPQLATTPVSPPPIAQPSPMAATPPPPAAEPVSEPEPETESTLVSRLAPDAKVTAPKERLPQWVPPQVTPEPRSGEAAGPMESAILDHIKPLHEEPVPEEPTIAEPVPAALAGSGAPVTEPASTDGGADTDADGNWVPPALRGMAPKAEREADTLPRRRQAS